MASARGEGLREERKALALRYTIDADEAMRREAMAAEPSGEQVLDVPEPSIPPARTSGSLPAAPEPETGRYVIQLSSSGFGWRWAVFEDLSVGDDPALALRSSDALATSAVPRWSARSARRAAERAARHATA